MTAATVDRPRQMPWWILLVQGIIAIIIGIMFLTKPWFTSNFVVMFIAIYWLITGVISIVRLFTDRSHWGWKLFTGIVGILAGLILLQNPAAGTIMFGMTVVFLLGFMGIFMGISSLIEAFRGGGWGPGIIGAISIIFGIILISEPVVTASVLPWVLGIFGIVGGIFAIFMSFRLRARWHKKDGTVAAHDATRRRSYYITNCLQKGRVLRSSLLCAVRLAASQIK